MRELLLYLLYLLTSKTRVCRTCHDIAFADKGHISYGDMRRCREGNHYKWPEREAAQKEKE